VLASILQASGLRTGLTPKPHLYTHRERVQINGELIGEAEFAALIAEIDPWVRRVAAEPDGGQPTVFEVMTLLAFLYFTRQGVERAVVEVGLGGRFDATNVLDPSLSIVTNIGLDHTAQLGNTLEAIAFEKAGIIRPGGRLVTGAEGPAWEVIGGVAQERGCDAWKLGRDIVPRNVEVGEWGARFDVETPRGNLTGLHLSLVGAHQVKNAALAVAAAQWLRDEHATITDTAIREGLAAARIAGRLEVRPGPPLLILDGAHNPDGARALAGALRDLFLNRPDRRLVLVLGLSEGHGPDEVVAALTPLASHVVATASTHPRAIPAGRVADLATQAGVRAEVVEGVPAAVERALGLARPVDVVCVTGSLFVLAEVPQS
jgi:dihydrofolate synthase/folylpolyglutamate synthase